jgi:O-acetylserine/cysteine efflux transporter
MKPADVAIAVVLMAIWGSNFVIAKVGLDEFPPVLFVALRFAAVAALLLPFVAMPRGRLREVFLLSVTLALLHFPLMLTGMKYVDASIAAITVQTQVPFSALLAALFFGDRLGWRRALGMGFAIAGVAILVGEPREGSVLWAVGLIVLASMVWAVAALQMKRLTSVDTFSVNAWMALFATPMLLGMSFLLEDGQVASVAAASWAAWGSVAFQSVAIVIVSYGLWFRLLRRYSVNQTMPYTLLVPVFGVLTGVVFRGEPVTWHLILGGLATVIGVGIIILRRPRLVETNAQAT